VIDQRSRTISWDGCVNVRDLGGLPTEDGGRTQPGRVIRSDNVGALSPEGWRSVAGHGVVRIVDLRFPEEVADDPPRDVDIEVVNVSVLGPSMHEGLEFVRALDTHLEEVDDIADHYAWSYVEFLERNQAAFGRALAAIADADGPVVIHCMGGKDRTGIVSGLLLRLAGVSLDAIGMDYALTAPNLAGRTAEWIARAPTERDRRRIEKLSRTPASAMARVIAAIEERHGSVEGFLAEAGVDDAQLQQLRARLR
jgi:protein tyrosine/serine phosphatase